MLLTDKMPSSSVVCVTRLYSEIIRLVRIISTTQMGRTNRVPRVAERELPLSSRAWDRPASAMGPRIRPSTMGTTLYL